MKDSNLVAELDKDNAIRTIMNRAKDARLNAAGGWGNYRPVPGLDEAFSRLVSDNEEFHAATRYSPTAGLDDLRRLIPEKVEAGLFDRNGVTPDHLVITTGGSTLLGYACFLLFSSPLLLPDPSYPNYLDQARLAGREVLRFRILDSDGRFLPRHDPERVLREFEATCRTDSPGLAVIISPDNPTGYIWPDEVLGRLITIADRFDVPVLLDRAYGPFYFGERPAHLSWTVADFRNLITVESFSKSFSLLGLRLAYAVAAPRIVGRLQAISQRLMLCPGTLEQAAMVRFLTSTDTRDLAGYLEHARQAYRDAYRLAHLAFAQGGTPTQTLTSDGGFYLVIRVPGPCGDDAAFCDALFNEARILAVPGRAFGSATAGWVRTAFAPHVNDPSRLQGLYGELASFARNWRSSHENL